ncbi:hypothetical protein AX14_010132 [Amanita brunnescens Koide BX004]|nr:hypothetical protein AX14_010132 [Amanita brunnescens Koide BX004]
MLTLRVRFNCLIKGEDIVFPVTVVCDDLVSDLKKFIQSERALDSLKDIDPHVREAQGLQPHHRQTTQRPLENRLQHLSNTPHGEYIHIIVKVPRTNLIQSATLILVSTPALKRKRDGPTDISQKLCSIWTEPVALDLQHLKEYLEKPLDPDWKIPVSYNQWKGYLASELSPAQACSDEDLELLFKQSEDETAVGS